MYNEQKFVRIEKIKWFTSCRGSVFADLPDWQDALECNYMDNWLEINMEENSLLISRVGREPEFDKLVEHYRTFFANRVLPEIQDYAIIKNIDFSIFSFVRLAVVNSLLEDRFKEKIKAPGFFTRLLEVYKTGHLPCGWKGNYPDGDLLVF